MLKTGTSKNLIQLKKANEEYEKLFEKIMEMEEKDSNIEV